MFAALGLIHAQSSTAPNVLLITIDTVRADHIGAYGDAKAATPAIDRLAREGVRFADATSQAPLTGPAHAAILTGIYPARFGLRDNATTPLPSSAQTMAELFKARGYRTGGFVAAFILDAQYGFAQGFDTFDSRFDRFVLQDKLKAKRSGGEVTDTAIKWLRGQAGAPFFAWVHLYDAHAPYESPAPYSTKFRASPYDGAVAYVDASVGRLVATLEETGALDRTLVVVMADHGESLGEHGEREHGFFLYDAVLRIPLVMRLPGHQHAGAVVNDQVRAIDVLPTIATLSGAPIPSGLDGENVTPLIAGKTRRDTPPSYAETYFPKLHFGWSELKSVRIGDWKYIDAPRAELYAVKRDPRELQNQLDNRGTLGAGLSAEIRRLDTSFGAAAHAEAPQPDPETLARLRSLGYIGVSAPTTSGGRGPDPKEMIGRFEQFRTMMGRAMGALERKQPDVAIPLLKQLIAENARSYELHIALGDAYDGTKQYRSALDEYAAAALLNPSSAAPVIASARAQLAAGDAAAALQSLDAAERIEPGTGEIALVRGQVFEQQGRTADAEAQNQAAARINGSDPQPHVRLAALAMQLGRYEQARKEFDTLLRLRYRPSRIHFGLGQVAQAQGDLKRAASEYRESLKLEPTFADARQALSRIGSTP